MSAVDRGELETHEGASVGAAPVDARDGAPRKRPDCSACNRRPGAAAERRGGADRARTVGLRPVIERDRAPPDPARPRPRDERALPLLPEVARRLLADRPCYEASGDLRYGARGSLVVHVGRGTWRDFEAGAGGGVLDLVEHLTGCDKAGDLAWLVDVGMIDAPERESSTGIEREAPCSGPRGRKVVLPKNPTRKPRAC